MGHGRLETGILGSISGIGACLGAQPRRKARGLWMGVTLGGFVYGPGSFVGGRRGPELDGIELAAVAGLVWFKRCVCGVL